VGRTGAAEDEDPFGDVWAGEELLERLVRGERQCLDCGGDISERSEVATRCARCEVKVTMELLGRHGLKPPEARSPKEITNCLDCGKDISNRGGMATRCKLCAVLRRKRKRDQRERMKQQVVE